MTDDERADRRYARFLLWVFASAFLILSLMKCAARHVVSEPMTGSIRDEAPRITPKPAAAHTPWPAFDIVTRVRAYYYGRACADRVVIDWGEPDKESIDVNRWGGQRKDGYQVEECGRFLLVPHVFFSRARRTVKFGFFKDGELVGNDNIPVTP